MIAGRLPAINDGTRTSMFIRTYSYMFMFILIHVHNINVHTYIFIHNNVAATYISIEYLGLLYKAASISQQLICDL